MIGQIKGKVEWKERKKKEKWKRERTQRRRKKKRGAEAHGLEKLTTLYLPPWLQGWACAFPMRTGEFL